MINPDLIEQTTAATDAVIGIMAAVCAVFISHSVTPRIRQQRIWFSLFVFLSIASVIGAITHGLVLTTSLHQLLWMILYASLGMGVALFMSASAADLTNDALPHYLFVLLIGSAIVFWLITLRFPDSFLVFIFYEAVGMLFSLFVYLRLALRRRPGTALIATSIVISLIAAIVQSLSSLSFHCIWTFDHNGLFHLIQMPGIILLIMGIRRSL